MEILYWKVNNGKGKISEEDFLDNYRAKLAVSLKSKEPLEIVRLLTFDGVSHDIVFKDIELLLAYINKYFLANNLKGVGLDVGAGCGIFSSFLAKNQSVKKVYAVEICEELVKFLMPKIVNEVLGNNENKVIGCVGSFNSLNLANSSVDFIFDFFSLHHSDDLIQTLSELFRVLKPGGFVVCLDKARPDFLSHGDLEELLSREYDNDYKKQFDIPLSQKLTRLMNGEREYRLKDWKRSFFGAGFKKLEHFNLAKCRKGRSLLMNFLKIYFLSLLPPRTQLLFTHLIPASMLRSQNLISTKNRVYLRFINPFPKEMSLLIAYKE